VGKKKTKKFKMEGRKAQDCLGFCVSFCLPCRIAMSESCSSLECAELTSVVLLLYSFSHSCTHVPCAELFSRPAFIIQVLRERLYRLRGTFQWVSLFTESVVGVEVISSFSFLSTFGAPTQGFSVDTLLCAAAVAFVALGFDTFLLMQSYAALFSSLYPGLVDVAPDEVMCYGDAVMPPYVL